MKISSKQRLNSELICFPKIKTFHLHCSFHSLSTMNPHLKSYFNIKEKYFLR